MPYYNIGTNSIATVGKFGNRSTVLIEMRDVFLANYFPFVMVTRLGVRFCKRIRAEAYVEDTEYIVNYSEIQKLG